MKAPGIDINVKDASMKKAKSSVLLLSSFKTLSPSVFFSIPNGFRSGRTKANGLVNQSPRYPIAKIFLKS